MRARRVWASIIVATLATFGAGSVRSEVGEDRLAAAEAAVAANAQTPEGKAFDEALGEAFGREHGKTIQRCAKEVKRPNLSNFELFLRLGADGKVVEALVKPETNLGLCVRDKLVGWSAPAPSRPDFWASVAVKLKQD